MRLRTIILFYFISIISIVNAQTYVSGTISENTTWTASNSPYIITGPVSIVDTGTVLTIEQNVEVQYQSNGYLNISGENAALIGTDVTFIGNGAYTIQCQMGNMDLDNCDFQNTGFTIHSTSGIQSITNSNFVSSQISASTSSQLTLNNNTISQGDCILKENSNGAITGNIFTGTSSIRIYGKPTATITNNTFSTNYPIVLSTLGDFYYEYGLANLIVSGNTFVPDTRLLIDYLILDNIATLPVYQGIKKYTIQRALHCYQNAALTIPNGSEIEYQANSYINISGENAALIGTDVTFIGNGAYTIQCQMGNMDLDNCDFQNSAITFIWNWNNVANIEQSNFIVSPSQYGILNSPH